MYASTAFFVGAESSPNVHQQKRGSETIIEEHEEEKDDGSWFSFRKIGRFMLTNVYAFVFLTYSLWTLLGILFYKYYDNFTTSTAYYYAMEAGLSIGFCNPSEKDDWSRLFTIFYVLLGSCFVSGAIGIVAASILSANPSLVRVQHEFGAFGMEDESGKLTVGSFFRFFWYHLKLLVGWYTNRSFFVTTMLFVVWVTWGTAFVMVFENYSLITGVYWAITTISTGGLQSPACLDGTDGLTCDIGAVRGGLMGFYMMLGVPIYAIFIAQVARYTVIMALRAREDKLLNTPITDADFLFAANILSPEGSETLVMGEFILLELMRLGLTNPAQIENIKAKFRRIDKERRGELDIDALRKIGVVVPRKLHSVELSRTRPRNRSMDLIGAIRFSATNLTDSIIAATANFQLGSPGRDRGRSNTAGGDFEAADRRGGKGGHDFTPERKTNDRERDRERDREEPESKRQSISSKASFRKSGIRRSQYLTPRDHTNQYNAEELSHSDGAAFARVQTHTNARHQSDQDSDEFAEFYYNKEETLTSPVIITRSSPGNVSDTVRDALEDKRSVRSSPQQQTEYKKPVNKILEGEYEDDDDDGYSDQDEDESIHVSYADKLAHHHHHQQHHVNFQGDHPPQKLASQQRQQPTRNQRETEKQQLSYVQSESMDI